MTSCRDDGELAYLGRNALAAAVLALRARHEQLDLRELGLHPAELDRGWRVARQALVAATAGGLVCAAVAPRVLLARRLLRDRRAALPPRQLAWQALVRIPLGTAAFEEFAFRGVLSAQLARAYGQDVGLAGSSVAFGLWHVGPTLAALRLNGIATGRWRACLAAVVATTAGGLGLGGLRVISRHLVASWLTHWATNAIGLLVAARWQRAGRQAACPPPRMCRSIGCDPCAYHASEPARR